MANLLFFFGIYDFFLSHYTWGNLVLQGTRVTIFNFEFSFNII